MSEDIRSLTERLIDVQSELKAPKGQYNSFGKYKYRSCEDILEAVKPLLKKHCLLLTITDEVHEKAGVLFVESTCSVDFEGSGISCTAQAGIDPSKKGMDISQCFGASSSYARKYALNGLFLIDDTKDADSTNKHGRENVKNNDDSKSLPDDIAAQKEMIEEVMTAETEGSKQDKIDMWSSMLDQADSPAELRKLFAAKAEAITKDGCYKEMVEYCQAIIKAMS